MGQDREEFQGKMTAEIGTTCLSNKPRNAKDCNYQKVEEVRKEKSSLVNIFILDFQFPEV